MWAARYACVQLAPIWTGGCNRGSTPAVVKEHAGTVAVEECRLSMNLIRMLCTSFVGLSFAACFIDNPGASVSGDAALIDAAPADALSEAARSDGAPSGPGPSDAGPALCTKYGGYSTIEAVVGDLFGALFADCRISRFFTVLSADKQGHLYDCLVKQVAVVMGCPGIRYDVDNAGVECRDMVASHKGLSIRGADFDALVQDLVTVMLKDGVAQADIDAVAPRLLALRDDIVTNSAPSNGKSICDAGGQ
jgi:hypothetical protein